MEPDGHWRCSLRESRGSDEDEMIGLGAGAAVGVALGRGLASRGGAKGGALKPGQDRAGRKSGARKGLPPADTGTASLTLIKAVVAGWVILLCDVIQTGGL